MSRVITEAGKVQSEGRYATGYGPRWQVSELLPEGESRQNMMNETGVYVSAGKGN